MEKTVPGHRIQCSYRILIGPLDDNSPIPFKHSKNSRPEPGPTEITETRHSEAMHSTGNISPRLSAGEHQTTQHVRPTRSNTTSQHLHDTTTDSNTAHCTTNNSNDTEHNSFLSQLETVDPASAVSAKSSSPNNFKSASKSTIPTDNGAKNSNRSIIEDEQQQIWIGNNRSKHDTIHTLNRTVLRRKSGPVFVPPLPSHISRSDDGNTVIKHDVLLCKRLIYSCNGKQPTAYQQSHTHSSSSKRQDDWRQLEMILTPDALTCYASSGLVWPKRTVQYHILLKDEKDSNLLLYLLSPLDYTFCLQYTPKHEKDGVTLVFRARTLTLCQEWYMAIYQLLPDHSRKPIPHDYKIYIPAINIHIHLPLIKLQQPQMSDQQNNSRYDSRYLITLDHVNEAIMDLLETDADWQAALENELDRTDLSLCWISHERAEWIFWKTSVSGNHAADMALCPQSIENTHQLELRPVQHTPHTIVLAENTTLQEPYPCEGFLTKMTGFEGQHLKTGVWTPKRFYFASFDGFLFVVPEDKTIPPHTNTYVDPKILQHSKNNELRHPSSETVASAAGDFNNPFVTLVTPFVDNHSNLDYEWQQEELDRRMKLVAGAVGCIKLTDVSFVRRSSSNQQPSHSHTQSYENGSYGSISSDFATSSTSLLIQHQDDLSSYSLSNQHDQGDNQSSSFELVMENGIIVKLQAYSSETCSQWISRLSDLILYSKARLEVDREMHCDNKPLSTIDSSAEVCEKGDIATTTNSGHSSSVDTRIWSLCPFTQCRDIMKSGIMYVQSKGVFSQKQFILTADGRLHYFNVYKRSGDDGKPIETGIHERKGTLDMANAYIYSGMMSSFDNEASTTQLDRPPRFFDNGITTNDPDEDCLFTIWIPQRRRIFSPRRQSIITYDSDRRFNSAGQRWLMMAPNRQDKEQWVWAISVIQEALLREAVK